MIGRELTREEIEAKRKRVRELRVFSRDPKSKLMGILMDIEVGGFAMDENYAEAKAAEILKEFTAFTI